MNSSQSTSLLALLSLCLSSCNIDEIPPEIVVDLRGWFTIESNNIGVNLVWSEVPDEDIDKYIIFKSTNNTVHKKLAKHNQIILRIIMLNGLKAINIL
tara:strand:- start:241 stop:534 length:294 start_codon:yes stop_codon:yes gene_type:complete